MVNIDCHQENIWIQLGHQLLALLVQNYLHEDNLGGKMNERYNQNYSMGWEPTMNTNEKKRQLRKSLLRVLTEDVVAKAMRSTCFWDLLIQVDCALEQWVTIIPSVSCFSQACIYFFIFQTKEQILVGDPNLIFFLFWSSYKFSFLSSRNGTFTK